MKFENKILDVIGKGAEKISWMPIKFYNRFLQGNKRVVNVNLRKVGVDFNFPFCINHEKTLGSLSSELRCFGIREPINLIYYTKFITNKDILLDVGAHFGFFSVLGQKAKEIIAVEPVEDCNSILRANLTMNGIYDKCKIIHVALGDGKDVYMERNKSSNLSKVSESGDYKIKSKTLKYFADKFNVNCIKVDIEGYEWDIFTKQKVPKGINKIAMEFHRDLMGKEKSEQLIKALYSQGFRVKYLIEDMPLRFYPFIWFTWFLNQMTWVKRNVSLSQALKLINEGRRVKYIYLIK